MQLSQNDCYKYLYNACIVYTYVRIRRLIFWGQPIKLAQLASTSELRENQRNNLLFFEIFPCHFFGAFKYKYEIGHNYFTIYHPKKLEAFFISLKYE